MAFLSNNKIKVFPTAFRGQDASGHAIDPGSFLTTEENFVNIANKVTYLHKDYFYVDGNIAHIILGGYYFVANVSDIQALFTNPANGDEIWAGINVADFGSAYESTSVKTLTPNGGSAGETLDDSTDFKGLTFLGKNDSKDGFTYKLKLFKRVSNAWVVEENSQVNIATNQISDGGDSSTPINKLFTTSRVDTNHLSASNAYINSTYTPYISGYSADTIVLNAGLLPTTCGPYIPQIDLGGYVYSASYYAHFRSAYISNVCLQQLNSDAFNCSIGLKYNSSALSGYGCELYYNDVNNESWGVLDITGFNRLSVLGNANVYLDSNLSVDGTIYADEIKPQTPNLSLIASYNNGTISISAASSITLSASTISLVASKIQGGTYFNVYANNSFYVEAGSGITEQANGDIRLQAGNTSGKSLWFTMNSNNASAMINASYFSFYMRTSSIILGHDTVGSPSKPIYLSNGIITPCNANVGSPSNPVYLKDGVITQTNAFDFWTGANMNPNRASYIGFYTGNNYSANPTTLSEDDWGAFSGPIFCAFERLGSVYKWHLNCYQNVSTTFYGILRIDLWWLLNRVGHMADYGKIDKEYLTFNGTYRDCGMISNQYVNPVMSYFYHTSPVGSASRYYLYMYLEGQTYAQRQGWCADVTLCETYSTNPSAY